MRKKLYFFVLTVFLLLCGGFAAFSADAYWTKGVRFNGIPGGGNYIVDLDTYNTKRTDDKTASFYCTEKSAALSNYARLINSNQAIRSDWANLSKDSLTRVKARDTHKNYYYFASVSSDNWEWNNNNYVK